MESFIYVIYPSYRYVTTKFGIQEFQYYSVQDIVKSLGITGDYIEYSKSIKDWSDKCLIFPSNKNFNLEHMHEHAGKPYSIQIGKCGRYKCACCGNDSWHTYMVNDELWDSVIPTQKLIVCWECFERQIGRELQISDLTDAPCNDLFFHLLRRIR